MPEKQKQLLQQIQSLLDSHNHDRLRRLLNEQRSSDIAEVVELLDNEQRGILFDALEKPLAAEVLEKVDEATRSELFEVLQGRDLAGLVLELDADDAADILSEMSEKDSAEVLQKIPKAESAEIRKLMRYSEDSAGGIMDPVLISVPEDATVAEAISKIRAAEIDEDFYSVYVVDSAGRFVGDVRIRLLLTSPEDTKISTLVDRDTIYVTAEADQEEVRNIFSKNDLIVVPVLDKHHRLIGRITADRIIEVAEEEAAEDLYTMAGTDPEELDDVSVFHAARVRMTWLVPCLIGTAVTASVYLLTKNLFIERHVFYIYATAVAFAPMIAAISGNAGLQTSAIVVSGLASGHPAALKFAQVFMREVRIALIVAACCGIIGGLVPGFLPHLLNNPSILGTEGSVIRALDIAEHLRIMFAFSVAMFSAIMVATTLGLVLPFVFRRIGIDPAISSGPLVTTANDSISVTIYMVLALLLTA